MVRASRLIEIPILHSSRGISVLLMLKLDGWCNICSGLVQSVACHQDDFIDTLIETKFMEEVENYPKKGALKPLQLISLSEEKLVEQLASPEMD